MIAGTLLAGLLTYAFMVAAYFLPRRRWFHIPVMVSCMLFDLGMPFYLYATGDWYKRLIEHEEILSFLLWMHLGLLITLYTLYALQIQAARRLLRGDAAARADHYSQGKIILLVRALVLATGGLLINPDG